ncbi:MAG: CaiB/BaiF CoA transferase family protein [Alphaproteobacteria bacterium]|jgi:CoA:oxalate CoA-transferase
MTTNNKKPLDGIKVLDLTRVLAGPYCGMVLQDLGAEVIKIENPKTGDDSRCFGPFKNGKSLYFTAINCGKKSLSLNLKEEEGKEILRELIKKSDVVLENFRPGTMEKFGLGYDVLKEINPRLIYAATSGFGHTGPDASKPAYDILVQARGGLMSLTGQPDSDPTIVGVSIGDILAGVFTATGIATALYQREKTGKGQKIDVAMLDCQVAIMENAMARYQATRSAPKPQGCKHPTVAPFQSFKASDRYFVVAVANDSLFKRLCCVLGCPEMADDPLFITNEKRHANQPELERQLQEIFITKTAQEWIDIIEAAGVPVSPINDLAYVAEDPQILARNMLVDMKDPTLPGIQVTGNPIKMSALTDITFREHAPEIGEHNREILTKWLHFSEEEITALKERNVI